MDSEDFLDGYQEGPDFDPNEPSDPDGEVHEVLGFDTAGKLGVSIFIDWVRYFTNVAINHDLYAAGAFHLLFGQLPDIKKIRVVSRNGKKLDPRIHLTVLSPSGSGKGEGQEFIERMAKHLELTVKNVSRTTEPGITGTIDRPENEGEVIVTSGYLNPDSGVDIIAASEASNIIKNVERDPAAQDMLNTLQIVMDTNGSHKNLFTKKLKENEEISYHPNCSLYLTSVYKGYMGPVILKGGFFQRMYLVIKQLGIQARREEEALMDEKEMKGVNFEENEPELATRMRAIAFAYRDIYEMHIRPEALEVFKQHRNETYDFIAQLRPTIQNDLTSFVGRFRDLQTKIAMHFACLNQHRHIEKGDALVAVEYTKNLIDGLIMYLHDESEAATNKNEEKAIARIIERVQSCIDMLLKGVGPEVPRLVEVATLKAQLYTTYRLPNKIAEHHLNKIHSWGIGEYKTSTKTRLQYFGLKRGIDIQALINVDGNKKKKSDDS